MPRKKKTVDTVEATQDAAAADPETITVELPAPEAAKPECLQCHSEFTWRDHAYGASSRNLCRTHDQQRQRAALRGSYVMSQTMSGLQPAISQGMNRSERRAAARASRIVSPPRKSLTKTLRLAA